MGSEWVRLMWTQRDAGSCALLGPQAWVGALSFCGLGEGRGAATEAVEATGAQLVEPLAAIEGESRCGRIP